MYSFITVLLQRNGTSVSPRLEASQSRDLTPSLPFPSISPEFCTLQTMSGSDHIPGSLSKLLALGLLLPFGSMAAIANARKSQPDLYAAHGHLMCSILIHTIGTILAALEQEPYHAHLCPAQC